MKRLLVLLALVFVAAPSAQAPPVLVTDVTMVRVYDGDTIQVRLADDSKVSVRFIGLDTPEKFRPRTPVQCWAQQATDYLKGQVSNGIKLRLRTDTMTARVDRYGRLLRHVYRGRVNVGYRLVRNGAARAYNYQGARNQLSARYAKAETLAKRDKLGLWGPPCLGQKLLP